MDIEVSFRGRRYTDAAAGFEAAAKALTDGWQRVPGALRRELEALVADKIERVFARGHYVTREEFEAIKEMAAKARDENDRLSARIAELEKKLGGG